MIRADGVDPAQYERLRSCAAKQDMTEWNAWREQNPEVPIQLAGVDLSGLWLQGADLRTANLQEANFLGADLAGAKFAEALLEKALFCGANLLEADFSKACCEGTKFIGANCDRVQFMYTKFDGDTKFRDAEDIYSGRISENFSARGAFFYNVDLRNQDFQKTNFEEAVFQLSRLEGAFFEEAYCARARFLLRTSCNEEFKKTSFVDADLKSAEFRGVFCEQVMFMRADLDGAVFEGVKLYGADFSSTHLTSKTRLLNCKIDEATRFTNTGLASIITEPGTRAFLERNIRKTAWEERYRSEQKGLLPWIKNQAVKCFWWISDYGYSTSRILWVFLGCLIFFMGVYASAPEILLKIDGAPMPRDGFRLFLFATATMVTLGFGNINAAGTWGMLVVCLNLVVGYFMLAVLVTRMAVMFQTMGPGISLAQVQKDRTTSKPLWEENRGGSRSGDG